MKITIPKYGQHLLFMGSTGCGKSVLGEAMLKHVASFFVFDTQDCIDIQGAKICKKPSEAINAIKNKVKKIIYKPHLKYHNKDINGYLIEILADSSSKKKRNERVIYIDEVFHLGYMQSFPSQLPIAMATCRQRGISLWISTQRPKLIPTNLISESSIIYLFYLAKGDDIKYIADNIRTDQKEFIKIAMSMKKDEHRFIKIDLTQGEYDIFPPLKIKN